MSKHHHAHHFSSAVAEFEASKQGMWLFMVTEVLMFGGLFVAYAMFRSMYPDMFHAASHHLNWQLGELALTSTTAFEHFTREFRRFAETDRQHSGRERIETAHVPRFIDPQQSPHALRRLRRRQTLGLVEQQVLEIVEAHVLMPGLPAHECLVHVRVPRACQSNPSAPAPAPKSGSGESTSAVPNYDALDVDRDGQITPRDVLTIVNALNSGTAPAAPAIADVDGDGRRELIARTYSGVSVNPFFAEWGLPAILRKVLPIGASAVMKSLESVKGEFDRRLELRPLLAEFAQLGRLTGHGWVHQLIGQLMKPGRNGFPLLE